MVAAMATPICNSSHTALLPEGDQTLYNNFPPSHRLQRNKKLSILFKFVQLMIAIACLVLFSAGGQLFTDIRATALTYGTYGAYIIIPLFLIAGFIIGEVTPVLLVGYNLLGAVMFAFVGSFGIDSWWGVRTDLDHISTASLTRIEYLNDMKLLSAILSLINAVLYAAETVIEGVILHDIYARN